MRRLVGIAAFGWVLARCSGNYSGAAFRNPGRGAPPPPAAPTVALTAQPATILLGQSTALTWTSTDANTCTAGGDWSGALATSGSASQPPAGTGDHTYSVSCTGAGGSASASATVTVNAPS